VERNDPPVTRGIDAPVKPVVPEKQTAKKETEDGVEVELPELGPVQECEVIIVGGSTAAFAAAWSSAQEGKLTCLLEPTDWVGGQMTTQGVSAIDFAHHEIKRGSGIYDVELPAKASENHSNSFMGLLKSIQSSTSNPGGCWVSEYCYEPLKMLDKGFKNLISSSPKLKIYYNTVVKKVTRKANRIEDVVGVTRHSKQGNGYDRFLSQDLVDWYSPKESSRFAKTVVRFKGLPGKFLVVVDASEFGDVLVLSGAPYLQGMDEAESGEGLLRAADTCGQSIVYPFVMEALATKTDEMVTANVSNPHYSLAGNHWSKVWTYRRLKKNPSGQVLAQDPNQSHAVYVGDLSMQNWNPGNDYLGGYIFKSKAETNAQIDDWSGGVNIQTLGRAEQHALGWYLKLKESAGAVKDRLALNRNEGVTKSGDGKKGVFDTGHGLSKMPYMRDSRRSLGLDNFVLTFSDLDANRSTTAMTGKVFDDRVGTGIYISDFHNVSGCAAPAYIESSRLPLPYFIPFRALTNNEVENLLVAGKTMAQTFYANSAVRLHPIEWSSGLAAGVAASFMVDSSSTTRLAYERVPEIQVRLRKYSPLQWLINGTKYPSNF
jgi:hypothetical protein